MKFLSIGECMLELAPQEGGLLKKGFAGDTFNTVWYVAQQFGGQMEPVYLTALGDDAASAEMRAFMRAAGVAPLAQVRPGKSVGLYMISLDRGERSFSYWRETSAARTLANDLGPLPVGPGDMVYVSGITLAILAPEARERLLEALRTARAAGARLAFDPNLRPRLWQSNAQMCHWTERAAASADICLPSFEDEAVHFGDRAPRDTCARYAQLGAAVVVVKDGAGPVTIHSDAGFEQVAVAPAQRIIDTTAAGDSFNAVLLARSMLGAPLAEAAAEAARLAARVIGAPGALVALE